MGAALDVPGNTTPCAEFNLFADPYAGAYLFSLPPAEAVNIVVCPLDITTPHAVPFPVLMGDEGARPKSPLLDFVVAFLGRVRGIYESLGLGDAMEMHDPMCVPQDVSSSAPPPLLDSLSADTESSRPVRAGSFGTRSVSPALTATAPTASRRRAASLPSSASASSPVVSVSSTGGAFPPPALPARLSLDPASGHLTLCLARPRHLVGAPRRRSVRTARRRASSRLTATLRRPRRRWPSPRPRPASPRGSRSSQRRRGPTSSGASLSGSCLACTEAAA